MTPARPLLIGVRDACALAGLPRDAGYQLVASGAWPAIRVAGRRKLLIPVTAIEAWIRAEVERQAVRP
jgi:excisionase family DNA binding protein